MLHSITFSLTSGPSLTLLLGAKSLQHIPESPHLSTLGSLMPPDVNKCSPLREGSDSDFRTRLLVTLRRVKGLAVAAAPSPGGEV